MTKKPTAGKDRTAPKTARAPRRKKETRVILFPLEPTSIPEEQIDAAVRAVIAMRKKSGS